MRRRRSSISVGHDAFLDIVANLVGILIILVVVLGAQSQAVLRDVQEQKVEEDPMRQAATEEELGALAFAAAQAASAQADSIRLERTIKYLDGTISQKAEIRTALLTLLNQAEAAWEAEQSKLDQERVAAAERETEAKRLKEELAQLDGEESQLEKRKTPVVAVSHLPTPMAKTVFGKEIHFRLKNNLISLVPIDGLTQEIQRDLRRLATGSREGVMDAAIGPVRGYVARYVLNRSNETVSRGGSIARMAKLQVMAASFEPLREPFGEPIQNVFANDDWLDVELAGHQPGTTTVTVWVYPDSYGAFRRLKEKLYSMGFATAARPLEQNRAIIASPSGSKSAAQ